MAASSSGVWVLAAPAFALAPLAPLIAARQARQKVRVLCIDSDVLLANPAAHLPAKTESLLIVAPRRQGPRQSLPGLWLRKRWRADDPRPNDVLRPADFFGRRHVPIGWLPAVEFGLSIYAHAAARILERTPAISPFAVLGQWEDRFLRVALRTSRWFEKQAAAPQVRHWTADRVSRPDLISGLQCGPSAAVYYGHGRANGWAGYHGVRVADFPTPWPEPIGGLFALCCENACRRGGRLSFAEELVLRGVCGSALAATAKTRHADNRQLGPALCEALIRNPGTTLAGLVNQMEVPAGFWDRTPYRFIGDPMIPLFAAADAATQASRIFAPAPDDELPPWEAPRESATAAESAGSAGK